MDEFLKQKILSDFNKMKVYNDFINLLRYVNSYENKIHIDLDLIKKYSNKELSSSHYRKFSILKKSGEKRLINAPVSELKTIQKLLSIIIQCVFVPHESANGFIWDRSVVDNAKLHIGKNYVFNLDIKDFFSSIEESMIIKCLENPPFYLNDKRNEIAQVITALCCQSIVVEQLSCKMEWESVKRNVLPQGAPTSPVLSNIVCEKLDYLLSAVAKRFNLTYSRYADDITFSSMHDVYQKEGNFLNELERIITEQGFRIKKSKTRLQKKWDRQEVTGLIVNKKVNLRKKFIKDLRMWLYYWENYGVDRANTYFKLKYKKDIEFIEKDVPDIISVLDGKLNYLKMVLGGDNLNYIKLKTRFDYCLNNSI
jgi:RNA-directed DNA polymerase